MSFRKGHCGRVRGVWTWEGGRKWQDRENYVMRSFAVCTAHKILLGTSVSWKKHVKGRSVFETWWHTVVHGRGNWRMEWVASTLHTTSKRGETSITTADAHTSAASSRMNWRPCRFKWTRPFRRKTRSSFCACAITFQTQSKAIPIQAYYRYRRFKELGFPCFLDCRHMKVIRLSALRTGRLYPRLRKYLCYPFLLEDMSEGLRQWKISNDIIRNRTRDLPACSTRSTSFSILLFWFALYMGQCLLMVQKISSLSILNCLIRWVWRLSITPLHRIILTPTWHCLRISIATVLVWTLTRFDMSLLNYTV